MVQKFGFPQAIRTMVIKMTDGVIYGIWDLLHIGHINILKLAAKRCNILYIGVFTDSVARDYKGRWPVILQQQRLNMIKQLKFDGCSLIPFLINFRYENYTNYNFLFISETRKGKKPVMVGENFTGKIVYLPYTPGISTTDIINRCKNL